MTGSREILNDVASDDPDALDRLRCIPTSSYETRKTSRDHGAYAWHISIAKRRQRIILGSAETGVDENDIRIAAFGDHAAVQAIDPGIVSGRRRDCNFGLHSAQ